MRRIWWSGLDIKDLVKKFALLVLVGILMIPTSLSFAGDALWLRYVLLVLIGLLVLYVTYTTLAVFYIIQDDEISIFYCWKFYHIKFNQIKHIEKYEGYSEVNMSLCRSSYKIKLKTNKGDIFISPSNRQEFLDALKEKRKGITYKE